MDSLGAESKKLKVLDSCPSFLLLSQSFDHQPVFPTARNLHHPTKPSNSSHSLFSVFSLSCFAFCLYWKWINSLKLKLLKVNSLNDWTAKLTDWDIDYEQLCYEHFSSHYWFPNLSIVSSQYIPFSTFSPEHSFLKTQVWFFFSPKEWITILAWQNRQPIASPSLLFWPHLQPLEIHGTPYIPHLRAWAHAVPLLKVTFAPIIQFPFPIPRSQTNPPEELLITPQFQAQMSPFLSSVPSQVAILSTIIPYSYFSHAVMGYCIFSLY